MSIQSTLTEKQFDYNVLTKYISWKVHVIFWRNFGGNSAEFRQKFSGISAVQAGGALPPPQQLKFGRWFCAKINAKIRKNLCKHRSGRRNFAQKIFKFLDSPLRVAFRDNLDFNFYLSLNIADLLLSFIEVKGLPSEILSHVSLVNLLAVTAGSNG